MRVLILSCNTGGGHNSCSRAIREVFTENGHTCDVTDAIRFVSARLSQFMSWGHSTMYRRVPGLFRFGYGYAEKHPAVLADDAAAYRLLTGGTEQLADFIRRGGYDTVICTHVFSGTLLHQTLKEYPMKLKTAFVATDYTCSPGAVRDCLEHYFIPAQSLIEEFASKGMPRERATVTGVPVDKRFYATPDPVEAKRRLGIDPGHTHLLMMCGSMGCGPMEKLTRLLHGQLDSTVELSVVCGTNRRLKDSLTEEFGTCPGIHIHGFVEDMCLMMDSADLYLTKPGGLSSSEALAKGLPMVLVDAVAGCERHNLEFFTALGGAVTADTPEALAALCTELLRDSGKRQEMSRRLRLALPGNAAKQIYDILTEDAL